MLSLHAGPTKTSLPVNAKATGALFQDSFQLLAPRAGHASGLSAIDISQDGRALLGVGLDASSRQCLVLWDISQLRYGGRVGACWQAGGVHADR